ncbi:MAG: hypothetical protein ACI3ZT_06145 [Candidatus Cryptobacteroides sp.]
MVKTVLPLALVFAFCLAGGAEAGRIDAGKTFLRQMQKRDSVLIADQLEYGFRMDNVAAGTKLMLPDYREGFIDSVSVLTAWRLDTLKLAKKTGTADISGSVLITSFDEGTYALPDIQVLRIMPDGQADTLIFKGQELDVRTMPVDTAVFKPHDIRGQIRYPLTFKEILPYILAFQLLAALAVLIWALAVSRKKHGAETGGAVKDPPYIVALRQLDKFRGNKYWAPDKQKFFYSGVTDVLREYIAARFGVGAMEMTTAEIFEGLKDKEIAPELMEEARELFLMSDLVKFAKMTVSDEDNVKAVPSAVRFVTATWKAEEEKEGGNVL